MRGYDEMPQPVALHKRLEGRTGNNIFEDHASLFFNWLFCFSINIGLKR